MLDAPDRFRGLVNDAVFAEFESSIGDVADAKYMPPYVYASPDWFEFEKASVYDHSWLALGRAGLAPNPGDYFTVDINDDPLMVVRDDEGKVRVFTAVCQHRGHLLAEGMGSVERGLFRCPLHSWSYNLQGKLVHAPEMNKTHWDKNSICLPELKVELWQGFVFASFDPDAEPLAPTLVQLEARDGELRRREHGQPPHGRPRAVSVELEDHARELHGALPQRISAQGHPRLRARARLRRAQPGRERDHAPNRVRSKGRRVQPDPPGVAQPDPER